MTEKIKVPQNVADAIEKMKEVHSNFGVIQRMEKGTFSPDNLIEAVGTLRYWTHEEEGDGCNADRLLAALVNGYEVEPKFKVGDLVHVLGQKGLHEITCISEYYADLKGLWGSRQIKNLRHATAEEIAQEKERRLWKSLGRDVKEFKNGDVGVMRNGIKTSSLQFLEDHSDDLVGFYPIESFVKFGGDE